MAADFAPGELLIQYASGRDAGRGDLYASHKSALIESIHNQGMSKQNLGALHRIKLGDGVDVNTAASFYAKQPGVLFAEPNWKLTTAAVSNDPYYTTSGRLWGMYGDDQPTASGGSGTTNQFGSQAEKAWAAGQTGSSSVYIGIVDEGVDFNHPDLVSNMWVNPYEVPDDGLDNDGNGYVDDTRGWDFYTGDNTVYDGVDDDHGTHVAGTIGAEGGNGLGVAGVSWDVTMIPTKFLGANGGYTSGAVKALDYLTDLKARHGINIVASSNSWGGGGYSSALHSAIIRGANAGILFVAAAGNATSNNDAVANYPSNYSTLQGTSTIGAASYEAVIGVAALTSSGTLASYSNYGVTTVDIGAPGSGVFSTLPGGTYGSYSGTSMATPHVSGAVALYASAHPGTNAASIRKAIIDSARPTAALSGLTTTGGRLDVAAALNIIEPVAISVAGASVDEGNAGVTALPFTVTLAAAASQSVTVNYATVDGTAVAGSDYTAQSGTLTFAPGELSKTILIDVLGDALVEANETLSVVLSAPSAGAVLNQASATGTINNDDTPPTPSLSIASASASENSGSLSFAVTLSAPSSTRVTVKYATAAGTAKSNGKQPDFKAVSGTLTFSPGETQKLIAVPIINDTIVEPNETLFVNLSSAVGGTIATARGTGTILNDDGAALAAAATGGSARAFAPATDLAFAQLGAQEGAPVRPIGQGQALTFASLSPLAIDEFVSAIASGDRDESENGGGWSLELAL
ncbi:MAG: hypothetical protein RI963_538 [Planctomycetota bacterium]|jgi:subtilisin family serine protease